MGKNKNNNKKKDDVDRLEDPLVLKDIVDFYLKGSESVRKSFKNGELTIDMAEEVARVVYKQYMYDVFAHGFDKKEAKELWSDVVIGIGFPELNELEEEIEWVE